MQPQLYFCVRHLLDLAADADQRPVETCGKVDTGEVGEAVRSEDVLRTGVDEGPATKTASAREGSGVPDQEQLVLGGARIVATSGGPGPGSRVESCGVSATRTTSSVLMLATCLPGYRSRCH